MMLATMASIDGDAPTLIDRVCVAAVWLMSLSGAGISLMADGQLRASTGVSEPGIAAARELQLELAEKPGVDVWTSDVPVSEARPGAAGHRVLADVCAGGRTGGRASGVRVPVRGRSPHGLRGG
jgi:hypothetical protein